MLLACLALGLISCRDTIDPREARPPSEVQKQASGPVTVLNLTCTLSFPDGQKGEVRCGESGAGKKGVSQNVILPWYSEYAVWLPFNLVKDTTTETWTFIASVKNLLGQPIGTLDGTTAVGSKVVVTYGPVATQGSGDVWITNADGTGNFTAPDQKYFNYPWIIDPQEISPYREMKTHVPNTVTEVSIGISISTDFPALQSVASTPPSTQPAWFDDDTSWAAGDSVPFPHLKGIVGVNFKPSATLAERQLAVAFIGAEVVGGIPIEDNGDGTYFLQVPDDGAGAQLSEAVQKLESLPQVDATSPLGRSKPNWLQPVDGAGWQHWSLRPDSLSTGWSPWALEAINAPMAWGCSTGDRSTLVGVIDHGFDEAEVGSNTSGGSELFGRDPTHSSRHGAWVTSVLAARGNDNVGMTGVMWRAGLLLADATVTGKISRDAFLVDSLGAAGAKIVNLSYGFDWGSRRPTMSHDSAYVLHQMRTFIFPKLRQARKKGHLPLIVISAGNSNLPAFLSGYPIIRDSFPALVVGATTPTRARWVVNADSGSNFGSYVDIYAPGADVPLEQGPSGALVSGLGFGTSFAAPLAAGVAGLILSFDPSVTADSLRSYIITGAQNGNRSVTDSAGTKYLLNAYESLKLAARRSGAPLCGNHVWLVGNADYDTVVVQRGAGATEKIWTDPDGALAIVNVKHGGRRISYSGPMEGRAIAYSPLTRQWQMESPDDSLPPAIDGGTFNSFWWSSHNGDSSVVVNHAAQSSPTVVVNLFDSHTLTSKPLATVPTSILDSFDSTCVGRKIADNSCSSMTWTGEQQEAYLLAAYSPMGDSAIISVSRIGKVQTLIPEWFPCGSKDSTGTYDHECRDISFSRRSIDTKFYTIPTRTVTSNPSVSWTMAGERVTQLVISEDGSELGIGHGAIDWPAMPDFSNCGITYRSLRTGQESQVIRSEPACIYFGAVTVSPIRRSPITLNYRE